MQDTSKTVQGENPCTTARESSDKYAREVYRRNDWRIIICRDGIQLIIQHRSGIRLAEPRWRSVSYITTREALNRVWPQLTGMPLLADFPERIGGKHG